MVQLDIPMPKTCYECPCHDGENNSCQVTGKYYYDEILRSCPLVELPSPRPNVPDTNVGDTISLRAAIERATEEHDFFKGARTPTDKARRDELLNVMCWLGELPSAQPESSWIPVTERLPLVTYDEHGNHSSEPVILCMESGEIEIGFFNPAGTFESADDDGLSVIGSIHAGTVDYMHVVAWMPFPKPYERSKE